MRSSASPAAPSSSTSSSRRRRKDERGGAETRRFGFSESRTSASPRLRVDLLVRVPLRDEQQERILRAVVAVAEARLHPVQRGLDLLDFLRGEQAPLVAQLAEHL